MTHTFGASRVGSELWYLLYEVQMAVYRGLTGRLRSKHVNAVASFIVILKERLTLRLPDADEPCGSELETAQQALVRVIRNSSFTEGWAIPLVDALVHLQDGIPLELAEAEMLLQLADAIDTSLY